MIERVRDFIVAVLKSPGSKFLLKEDFLSSEYEFAKKLEEHEALDLRIDQTVNGEIVLLWNSKTKQTLSCQISVDGYAFDFTNLGCYNSKKKVVKRRVSSRLRRNKKQIIAEEVTIIKELILVYDIHLEKFFF